MKKFLDKATGIIYWFEETFKEWFCEPPDLSSGLNPCDPPTGELMPL